MDAALERIEAAGYGVTRLWTAEACAREDDLLGLAVIENRRRPRPSLRIGTGRGVATRH